MQVRRHRAVGIVALTLAILGIALFWFDRADSVDPLVPPPLAAQIKITPRSSRSPLPRRTAANSRNVVSNNPRRATTKQASPKTLHDEWQVIYLDNKRVGYSHAKTESVRQNRRELIRTTINEKMKLKRSGDNLEIGVTLKTEETRNGDLVSYELEIRNPPASTTRTVGSVNGKRLDVELTVAGTTRKTSLDWGTEIKSPAYQDRLMRESPLRAGETRRFRSFSPELNQIATISLDADILRDVKLLDGSREKLLKIRVTNSLTPQLPLRHYCTLQGIARKTESLLLGRQMNIYTVPAVEALKEISGEGFDIGIATLVRVKPLRRGHRSRKVVYRITTSGQDPTKAFPDTANQLVKKIDEETLELSVTALPIPKRPRRIEGPAEYLQSTRFLQSDDTRVAAHARAAAFSESDPALVAVKMEKYVNRKLAKKNLSTALASAAEVAKNLEGDCTEHAVLLAAMLRARRIPSRIAVGLVYVEGLEAFGGHMWTEAWLDGKWIPLDATLGRGGIGAAHIKMSDSSFADNAPAPFSSFLPLIDVLGKIKIDILSAE